MDAMKEVYGKNARLVKWKLDTTNGYATPLFDNEHLGNFKVPLNPFMSCLGLAAPSESEIMTSLNLIISKRYFVIALIFWLPFTFLSAGAICLLATLLWWKQSGL